MTILTLCQLFPELLGRSVSGIVLTNSTDRTPTKTATAAGLVDALRPLWVVLLYLVRFLWPVVWVGQWLGFLNGSAHIISALTGFAGKQTRGQIDRAAYLSARASPSVLARGVLAMFGYDEPDILRSIQIPVLVVTGNLDRLTVPEASAAMSQKAPRSDLVRLTPAGHQGIWEQHAQLAQAVVWFAAQRLGIRKSTAA
jgi:pimeloyl-ACP methyl ester carboxylesterase